MGIFVVVVSALIALGSMLALSSATGRLTIAELTDGVIVENELRLFGLVFIALASLIVLSECVRLFRLQQRVLTTSEKGRLLQTMLAWVTGVLAMNTAGIMGSPSSTSPSQGVPADGVLSPAAATAVLAHIIRRRREQLVQRFTPDVLTVKEKESLSRISEISQRDLYVASHNQEFVVTSDVQTVLTAVDRERPMPSEDDAVDVVAPWLVEVKVFGYPLVVTVDGTVAEFRKKRALELLTWLTLNRERARRSTARTAMWELDVSDSSFSTVVSDLRRALRDAVGHQKEGEFLPTTYSDELPLSHMVTTDADRLQNAYSRFKETHVVDEELRCLLQGMRDIPLAGTSYSWADLDGTTTRLVMSALVITVDVARISIDCEALDDALVATSAGLRVFPGCEELLDLQRQCLQRVANPLR